MWAPPKLIVLRTTTEQTTRSLNMNTNRVWMTACLSLLCASGALAQPTISQSQTTLLIRSDETAFISVDGRSVGTAQAYSPMETPVLPGNHLVSAVALTGLDRSDQSVRVGGGERTIVLIGLRKAEAPQQQQAVQQKQNAQSQQCRDQLQAKRAEYTAAVQNYMKELQQARDSAQAAQLSSGSQSGPQWLQGLNGALSGIQKMDAAQHQNNAEVLKIQVDQLRQDVSDLQRCAATQ